MSTGIWFGEVPLERLGPRGDLRESLLAVKRPWVARGVARWLGLVDPGAAWPVAVFAAAPEGDRDDLQGALVAVWNASPIERFDDLLERPCPTGERARARPAGGTWHFISVTTRADVRGGDLGRELVKAALAWVAQTSGGAEARTLSPAMGLPALAAALAPSVPFAEAASTALREASRVDGTPALPILRLHLGAGAWLDRTLFESRADDRESGEVTLRFGYRVAAADREAQRDSYRRWCAARAEVIAGGGARAIAPDLWQVREGDVTGSERLFAEGPPRAAPGGNTP